MARRRRLIFGLLGLLGLAAALLLPPGCGGSRRAAEATGEPEPLVPTLKAPISDADFPSPTAEPPTETPWPQLADEATFDPHVPRAPAPTPELAAAVAPNELHPPARGQVKAVSRSRRYLTLDCGSDDGVAPGMTFWILQHDLDLTGFEIPATRREHRDKEGLVARAIIVQVRARESVARVLDVPEGDPILAGDVAVQQPY